INPFFPTQVTGSAAISPNQLTNTTPASTSFSAWNQAGPGIHGPENSAPGSVSITAFDAQFSVALSDFSTNASNVIGAVIGRSAAQPARLFVDRSVAMVSRSSAAAQDLTTLSLGAVDAAGTLL